MTSTGSPTMPRNGTTPRAASAQAPARRRRLGWSALAVPALAVSVAFFVYPVAEALRRSFTDFIPPESGGFDNYAWFFGDAVNITILVRTVVTGVAVTTACLVIGYPFAYLMTVAGRRLRAVLLGVVLVQFWSSAMAQTFAWVILLQDNGPVDSLTGRLGLGHSGLLGTVTGAGIGMTQAMVPFMILPLYSTMQGIDRRLVLAAQTLGARPAIAFFRVYVPMSMPGVLSGSLMVFVLSLGFYITPSLLGSPQQMLLSQYLVTEVNSLLAWGRGGAMAAVMIFVTGVFLLFGWRFVRPTAATATGVSGNHSKE
ncbi:ABC transporter permease [Streptomyces sp. NPDC005820]|uniref:ABC transporter permease n=1 Tax=Streptomyces sp. NPDC005820 TaxID=3157069 RepID=UPI0033FFB091